MSNFYRIIFVIKRINGYGQLANYFEDQEEKDITHRYQWEILKEHAISKIDGYEKELETLATKEEIEEFWERVEEPCEEEMDEIMKEIANWYNN